MSAAFVDSNVILDLFLNDPIWADWSEKTLIDYLRCPIFLLGLMRQYQIQN